MKVIFTGGGTGGHFYPIIAVAEALNKLSKEYKLLETELYYLAPTPYNEGLLFENGIKFRRNSAGKLRRYFSIANFFDLFRTGWGIITAFFTVFSIFPDVVFGKGGYVSVPTLLAARILGIPVIIHESDSVPGRANAWASKFAKKIAISYPDAAQYFPQEKVAYTGNPIRKEIEMPLTSGAHEFLKLDPSIPTILILGGSQGSQLINDAIVDALPRLLEKFQVIHQTGPANYALVKETANVVLGNSQYKDRYKPFEYLNNLAMRMAAGVAKIVISRAGSTIFEIAAWGTPSIIIPITDSQGDHQRKNAFAYARIGACEVIEEKNLSSNILVAEIDRITNNPQMMESMKTAAKGFARLDAAEKIAREILSVSIEHEK